MTGSSLGVALLYLLAACLPICAQSVGSVTGRVTCADSRTPCRYASVTIETAPLRKGLLAENKLPSHSYAAATDLDGNFAMKNVVPGEYYITALEAGYLSPYDLAMNEVNGDASLKAQAVDIALERVSVQAGQTTTANVLLSRGASLSGTVRYEDGGPAIGVAVNLFRKDGAGKWQLYTNTAGSGDMALAKLGFGPRTDDRGRFYAPCIPQGTYALQANLPDEVGLLSSITGKQFLGARMIMGGALQVFYGDAYRLKDAKPIELHDGEERSGLDIDIPTSGMHTIGGTVTGGTEGVDSISGKVQLLDPDDKTVLREALILAGGVFVFENVRKGAYVVRVQPNSYSQTTPVRYEPFTVPLLVETDVPNLNYRLVKARP